jgi:hypothetical protein
VRRHVGRVRSIRRIGSVRRHVWSRVGIDVVGDDDVVAVAGMEGPVRSALIVVGAADGADGGIRIQDAAAVSRVAHPLIRDGSAVLALLAKSCVLDVMHDISLESAEVEAVVAVVIVAVVDVGVVVVGVVAIETPGYALTRVGCTG